MVTRRHPPYGNRRRDPRTGRFVGRFATRQTLRALADLPDHEWTIDEEAAAILVGGVALAIERGWRPPADPSSDEVRS